MRSRFSRRFLPVGLALAILATPLATYPVRADSDENDNSLTGSWLVHLHFVTPVVMDKLGVGTFTKEGTFVGSLQGDVAGAGPAETPGHGVWAKTGARNFAVRFQAVGSAPDGSFISLNTVTMQLTLDAKSNQFSGTWDIKGVDANRNTVFSAGGTLTAERILIQ